MTLCLTNPSSFCFRFRLLRVRQLLSSRFIVDHGTHSYDSQSGAVVYLDNNHNRGRIVIMPKREGMCNSYQVVLKPKLTRFVSYSCGDSSPALLPPRLAFSLVDLRLRFRPCQHRQVLETRIQESRSCSS